MCVGRVDPDVHVIGRLLQGAATDAPPPVGLDDRLVSEVDTQSAAEVVSHARRVVVALRLRKEGRDRGVLLRGGIEAETRAQVEIELNGVCDNPIFLPDDGIVVSVLGNTGGIGHAGIAGRVAGSPVAGFTLGTGIGHCAAIARTSASL